jgi:hypothetical protein
MKKSVKTLIILNLLTYINNFLFSFTYTYANETLRKNWLFFGIWFLSPYIFVTITSFIFATDNKEEYKTFKKEAVVDWIIRFISCCVVFQNFKFQFLSVEYIVQQGIVALLLIINILLEFRMYKKAGLYVPTQKDYSKIEKVSEAEKQNIRNIGKAATLGINSFLVYVLGSLSVFLCLAPTKHVFNTLFSRLMALTVSVVIFLWFQQTNYKKCNLFYLDKELAKRIFIRDSIYATVGYVICFLAALNVLGTESKVTSIFPIISILFLYPTIQTNRKIGLRYKKIVEILGDNFELYFTCNDKK